MTQIRWWWTLLGTTVAVVLGVGGWSALRPAAVPAATSLPRYGTVPPFALVNQYGQPVTREMLDGHPWVAEFIFTRCSGQCPMMVMQMRQLHERLPAEAPVRLIAFTVDPDYDTPERLARYAAEQQLPQERWWLLTGAQSDILRLSQEGFHLSAAPTGGTVAEPITHSRRLVLVDGSGHIRGYYDAEEVGALDRLLRALHAMLQEPPS